MQKYRYSKVFLRYYRNTFVFEYCPALAITPSMVHFILTNLVQLCAMCCYACFMLVPLSKALDAFQLRWLTIFTECLGSYF